MIQTATHFCSITFSEKLVLNPINVWEEKDDKVMFVVRGEQPLEETVIQLVADNQIVWESPLRTAPKNAIQHPFSAEDDESIVYVSSHFVTSANLKVETAHYTVQLVQAVGQALIDEIPFTIEFFEKELEESEADIDVLNRILATNSADEESESAVTSTSGQVPFAAASFEHSVFTNETVPVEETTEQLEAIVEKASIELEEQSEEFVVDESEAYEVCAKEAEAEADESVEHIYTDELQYDIQIVSDILVAANETNYSIEQFSDIDVVLAQYEIVIEKMGNQYIAVINDPSLRPMFLLENGQFIKQWDEDFVSYLEWLKGQLTLMFNISVNESNNWTVLLIDEEEMSVDNEKVTVIDRTEVVSVLTNYPVILDVTELGTLLALNFENGVQSIFVFDDLTAIEELQDVLPKWQQVLNCTYILPTGLLANPAILEGLSEQLKEASDYHRTSLAWELVMKLIKDNA